MKKSLAHLPQYKQNELEQLASCVKKLHEVTEKICKDKIESFALYNIEESTGTCYTERNSLCFASLPLSIGFF